MYLYSTSIFVAPEWSPSLPGPPRMPRLWLIPRRVSGERHGRRGGRGADPGPRAGHRAGRGFRERGPELRG